MALYLIANGAAPTTAAQVVVTTSTLIKTLLQIKPGSTVTARVVEWGISFDGTTANSPIKCELLETDVAATVTASVATDIVKLDNNALCGGDPTTALISVGVAATGYTSTAEGAITSVRMLDVQLISPTSVYVKQFPLGREPIIQAGKFGRIRVTAASGAVNAYCYIILDI